MEYKNINDYVQEILEMGQMVANLTRSMVSLAHEVKLIDERLHDLEVKHEK